MTPTGAVTEIRNPYTGTMISLKVGSHPGRHGSSCRRARSRAAFPVKVTTPVFFRAQQEFYGEAWPAPLVAGRTAYRLWVLSAPWRAGFAVLDNVPLS